jgi:hypothetical protein
LSLSCLKSLAGGLALAVAACLCRVAFAQDAWTYTSEIPCATAPVYGVPFTNCWISNTRTFRIGTVQSWRLAFVDQKSEFAIGLYSLVQAHGSDGMSPVAANSGMIDWIRASEALRTVATGGTGWAVSGDHVTFQKPQRQCIGFVRNGPAYNGQQKWILGAAFCRESTAPLSDNEAAFIADTIKVRQ